MERGDIWRFKAVANRRVPHSCSIGLIETDLQPEGMEVNLTTKVQYRSERAVRRFGDVKIKNASMTKGARLKERCNFRGVAAHHAFRALGIESWLAPEKKRLLELAVNEAEALACATGVPELVLLTLAEEKVRATRLWQARQERLKKRSLPWSLEFAE